MYFSGKEGLGESGRVVRKEINDFFNLVAIGGKRKGQERSQGSLSFAAQKTTDLSIVVVVVFKIFLDRKAHV